MNRVTVKTQIKCGNIEMGVFLLDDIRDRLNNRLLGDGFLRLDDITVDNHTWISVHLSHNEGFSAEIVEKCAAYIKGMISGILLWSGVEVI